MKKGIFLVLTVVVVSAGSVSAGDYSGGTGEPNDPYRIAAAEDLNDIGNHSDDWGSHFVMVNDINLADYTGTEFNIIGEYYWDWETREWIKNPFTGVFDGNSHTISNFTYTVTNTDDIGLFGCADASAVIKDLILVNSDVNAAGDSKYVGSLVGCLRSGTITGCSVEGGSVTGYGGTGGLVGENLGRISNCYAAVRVTGDYCTGGLVACNDSGTISNCYATGGVTGGNDCTGGLLGYNGSGTISNCYAAGSVTGDDRTGGLVGYNRYGTISASYWDIETTGQSNSAGGEGKTTAQMQTESTFLGWAACGNELWTINEGDYPRLVWEGKPGEPLPVQQLCDFLTGSGTAADPYLICTAEQLNLIGLFICEWDRYFVMTSDINLSGYTGTQFNVIGQHYQDQETQVWIENPFTGVFDGNGFSISNFTYKSIGTDYIGLFGYIDDANAVVKDLTLTDPNVGVDHSWHGDWGWGTAALVGELKAGTITGCSVEGGSVMGRDCAGGLVGYNNYKGTISNCYATGSVTGYYYTGGLVGRNDGTILNCYAAGSVTGYSRTGGLVGCNVGTISNCYATGSVMGEYFSTGGLVGSNHRTISNCYAIGNVTGDDRITGGLVGYNDKAMVSASFWDIEIGGPDNGIGTPLPTSQMQTESTFTDAGWDFTTPIWKICEDNDYPRLWWEECRPIEVELLVYPRVIVRHSRQKNILAWIRLPEGVGKEQISDEPILLYPGEIEAVNQYVIEHGRADNKRTSVLAFFSKAELMDAVVDNGQVEVEAVGSLTSGRYFYGSDTVMIKARRYRPSRRWR